MMKLPRFLLAAGASGSGKTLITCGLLQVLANRNIKTASFKCGPDYIDPMFHSRVIGTKSRNLDTFFTTPEVTRYLLGSNGADCEMAVIEGVMGYYDGLAGISSKASAWDVADVTDTPVILLVNSKGMSVSLVAYIKGFLDYKKNSHIKGVIFNRMSPMLYPRMKELTEKELGVEVLGFVPEVTDCCLESRHLGLILPREIPALKEKLLHLAEILEHTLDVERILELAKAAPALAEPDAGGIAKQNPDYSWKTGKSVRIGVARDEAFCFFYEDNFHLLKEMGAELVFFSPIYDKKLPEHLDGLLLCGGYPELFAKELSENVSMREEIRRRLSEGMACMAECGGFMYLHQEMEDMKKNAYSMVGAIDGTSYRTEKLGRFGYITLYPGEIPAHEFHYFDSTNCGEAYEAKKPLSKRGWRCIHDNGRLLAGFPHFYYYGNPGVPKMFLERCLAYQKERI